MRKGRVLIVDDEIGQYEVLKLYLEPLPLELHVAEGTGQAIKMLSADRYDAVLCDLVMNGGGGIEVLRFVQSRGIQTPTIVITGYGDEQTADECFAAGAFDFVAKHSSAVCSSP